ncbi:murein L,D-transpeptidase catalytic domain family protein [Flavobacterium agrisoli]|uniref:Murein L,D-transpeptidase catalytic domain family protein n=1 Tax=Flavobacterium agrisoli TaxID=2793066 RepID=A0A934UKE4_9FLAO|nr:murein L,D-transpeptidase catalytic domain family protein [Flavobacterium agrisoli]MBK0370350.1 murein L,D-transpeptidase catalytic domain family protein [Flavobacterium agrisoli]
MIYTIFPTLLFAILSFTNAVGVTTKVTEKKPTLAAVVKPTVETKIASLYQNLKSNSFELPQFECFNEALHGFYLLKDKGVIQKNILTLIDFSKSANQKRLWVIDLTTNTILYHSLVSHGRNTGEEFATSFSNTNSSNKSSLGFYATAEVYNGKHGMSLRLDGLEKGVNDNARARAIVMHGADYCSDSFIHNNKRLGRSLGCPAIPESMKREIIETIKGKSCLYIYHPSRKTETLQHLIS